jgi:alkylation response protein AidB-like acyl-CoA dehydrogenase
LDFAENEDIQALRDLVRRFLEKEVPPELAAQWDRDDLISRDWLKKLGDLGLCALGVPEEYGGMGPDVLGSVVAIEELARRSIALASVYTQNVTYGGLNISHSGTPEQKDRLLPGLRDGEIMFAYGLSEPDVGADLASVTTRAELRGDTVVVNGAKRWCTGAGMADYIYALVRSGDPAERYKNLSFVLIPTDLPGITIQAIGVMGSRGVPTNDVIFEDVEVPAANIIGGPGKWNQGWSILAGPALETEKLGVPALALGVAEAAVAEAWQYAEERRQFGGPISGIQSIRHMLADARTRLQASRLMLYLAAWKVHVGQPSAVETSMAKLYVADTCRDVVLSCQQVMGAYGYAHGFAMERYVRDILVMPIFGGSSAIQKNNIANLLKLAKK